MQRPCARLKDEYITSLHRLAESQKKVNIIASQIPPFFTIRDDARDRRMTGDFFSDASSLITGLSMRTALELIDDSRRHRRCCNMHRRINRTGAS